MRYSFLLVVSLLGIVIAFGQKKDPHYSCIDRQGSNEWILTLCSDTTVEFCNIPKHIGPIIKRVHRYSNTDSSIEISADQLNVPDTLWRPSFINLPVISQTLRLIKIDEGFIDYKNSLIFIDTESIGLKPALAYIINGKTYWEPLDYSSTKRNRRLQKRLKKLNNNNCTLELLKGLDAYKRLGVKYVFGVFIITTKNNPISFHT